MLSTELEDLCTGLKCFLQGWNAFDRARIPLYRVGILSAGLKCFLQGWNAFYRVGIPLYRIEMLSRG
jgi:ABC-type glycerol-3-phosphate transport system permease component